MGRNTTSLLAPWIIIDHHWPPHFGTNFLAFRWQRATRHSSAKKRLPKFGTLGATENHPKMPCSFFRNQRSIQVESHSKVDHMTSPSKESVWELFTMGSLRNLHFIKLNWEARGAWQRPVLGRLLWIHFPLPVYTPENNKSIWKWSPGKGDSYGKIMILLLPCDFWGMEIWSIHPVWVDPTLIPSVPRFFICCAQCSKRRMPLLQLRVSLPWQDV